MKPIFRDPDEGDEREDGYSEPFGFLLGPMGHFSSSDMSDEYFRAANLLVERIQDRRVADHEIAYPVLFLYRHAMELMVKAILTKPSYTHHRLDALADDLSSFVDEKYGQKVPDWIIGRLKELARIDPTSQAFRYGEDKFGPGPERRPVPAETYVRVMELHQTMNRLYEALQQARLLIRGDFRTI